MLNTLLWAGIKRGGGIDDWFLSNGTLCAVISDPSHENNVSVNGGYLIDLGHCGGKNDRFIGLYPLLNSDVSGILNVDHIRAEEDENHARIITHGKSSGYEFTGDIHIKWL